jgi:hypothetical protein
MIFSQFAAWQGGSSVVPWDLIEADGASGAYNLIERKRLPEGFQFLRRPTRCSVSHRAQLSQHLRAGDAGELPDENIFQFLQPSPGVFELDYRTERRDESRAFYAADSAAYLLRRAEDADPVGRADGLPDISPNNIYVPLLPEEEELVCPWVANEKVVDLLSYLREIEKAGAHHVRIIPCELHKD